MNNKNVNYVINKILNNRSDDNSFCNNYLKLINIGMNLYYEDNSKTSELFDKIKILNFKQDNMTESFFSDTLFVNSTEDYLYLYIDNNENSLTTLEGLVCEINDYYNKYCQSNLLNQFYNILQSEEIIKVILNINNLIDDTKLLDLYDELNVIDKRNYKCCIKQILVNLVRPLYETIKDFNYNYKEVLKEERCLEINEMFTKAVIINDYYLFSEIYRKIRVLINRFCLKLRAE